MTQADLAREFDVTPVTAGRWAKSGCPLTSPEHAAEWLEANDNARHTRTWRLRREAKGITVSGMAVAGDEVKDPSVRGMLARVQHVEQAAFEEVQLAAPGLQRAGMIQAYNNAVKLRQNSEREIVDLLREMGELVPPQEARDLMTAALGPVAKKIDSLDDDLAEQVNPTDPELARGILASWKEELKAMVRAALEGGEATPAE